MYSGLNPLELLNYPAEDVFKLIADTIAYNERHHNDTLKETVTKRPAGDDWF